MENNDLIQKIQTLLEKKNKLFVVEGPHLVEEALPQIEYIVCTRDFPVLKKAKEMGIPSYKVTEKEFKKATDVVTPQGILAAVRKEEHSLESLTVKNNALIVFAVNIQDPGNLGAIIRSADAAAASGIIVTADCADVYSQKVLRSTAGSIFHLPVVEIVDTEKTLEELKRKGFRLIAADTAGIENYWETDFKEGTVILIGNEGAGLPESVLNAADSVVKVPIIGRAESLNAAMAASIILYEAVRQRNG